MDAGTNLGFPAVERDQYRLGTKAAWVHSYEGYTDKIYDVAQARGFGDDWDDDFIKWKFMDDKPLSTPRSGEISFNFGNKGEYDVAWKYDNQNNQYLRFNGGAEHVDHETGKQLSSKNIVVQYVKEKSLVDKEGHMFYTTTGTGEAVIFQNGDIIEGKGSKNSQSDRTMFFDGSGKEISFVRGVIWIEAVPSGNEIKY